MQLCLLLGRPSDNSHEKAKYLKSSKCWSKNEGDQSTWATVYFNRAPPSTGSQPPLSLQPPHPRTPVLYTTCTCDLWPPSLSLPPYFGPNGAGYYHPRQGILKHQISSTSSSQVERCSISVFIRWMCPLPPAPFNQTKSFHLFWPVLILNDFTQVLMQHCITIQGKSMKQKITFFPSFLVVSFFAQFWKPDCHFWQIWIPHWTRRMLKTILKGSEAKGFELLLGHTFLLLAIIIIVVIIIIKRICHWNRLYVNEAKNHNK